VSRIKVRQISGEKERMAFLTFPWTVYRYDPLWVPPLLPRRAEHIDPERGVFFQRGEADFFIAWRDGVPVGTICAGVDPPTNSRRKEGNDCLFGFFECIRDYDVARAMFDRVRGWAEERGLDTLFGPFNLDYEDSYGILVNGRERPPAIFCGHTAEYYQGFVEEYGFVPARADSLAFAFDLDLETPQAQRVLRLADRVRKRGRITIRGADLQHWDDEIDRIHRLLTVALSHLPGHLGWRRDVLENMLQPFRDIADPDLVLFAEVDGEPVGWFPGIPNLNEAFARANGLRRPWDYLRLWWHMRQQPDCLAVKSVLVAPKYWGTGVAVLMFAEMGVRAKDKGYKWLDLSLTGADNANTPMLADRVGAPEYKRYRVYRLPL